MTATTLPWQAELLDSLTREFATDRLAHALALSAAPGWGVERLADELVGRILELPGDQPVIEVAHPDFLWMLPDGAMYKVDQIREVRDYAVQTPQIAKSKVVVLTQAELLTVESGNALLKTLEEPPPNTFILLCTENWGRLLPTVRSRCQRREIRGSKSVALDWLATQGTEVDPDLFRQLGNAPLVALDPSLHGIKGWLDQLTAHGVGRTDFTKLPEDLTGWLSSWYRIVVDMTAQLLKPLPGVEQLPAEQAEAAYRLIDFSDELLSARRQLQTRNFNTKPLLVQGLAYRWSVVSRSAKL